MLSILSLKRFTSPGGTFSADGSRLLCVSKRLVTVRDRDGAAISEWPHGLSEGELNTVCFLGGTDRILTCGTLRDGSGKEIRAL